MQYIQHNIMNTFCWLRGAWALLMRLRGYIKQERLGSTDLIPTAYVHYKPLRSVCAVCGRKKRPGERNRSITDFTRKTESSRAHYRISTSPPLIRFQTLSRPTENRINKTFDIALNRAHCFSVVWWQQTNA